MEKARRSARSPVRGLVATALAIGALVAIPSAARAQELTPPSAAANGAASASAPTTFGRSGEWVISVESYTGGTSASLTKQASDGTSVFIQPALDYFIGSGISVGGVVGYGHAGSTSTVNFEARAGFNQSIVDRLSFWPTAGIEGSYQSGSDTTAKLVVLAPFLFHPAPHFFLGGGPFLTYLVKGGPDTFYGLEFVIGGWL